MSLGRLVLFANHCPLAGDAAAAEVYRFFPASLVLYGVMLFAEGRLYWGRLYLLGLSEVVAAVVVMQVLSVAPIVSGLWHAVVLIAIASRRRCPFPGANGPSQNRRNGLFGKELQ